MCGGSHRAYGRSLLKTWHSQLDGLFLDHHAKSCISATPIRTRYSPLPPSAERMESLGYVSRVLVVNRF